MGKLHLQFARKLRLAAAVWQVDPQIFIRRGAQMDIELIIRSSAGDHVLQRGLQLSAAGALADRLANVTGIPHLGLTTAAVEDDL